MLAATVVRDVLVPTRPWLATGRLSLQSRVVAPYAVCLMNLQTADLCDARDDAQARVLPFRSYGQRRAFAGRIRTVLAG